VNGGVDVAVKGDDVLSATLPSLTTPVLVDEQVPGLRVELVDV
jgi:hypothetical protein